MYYINKLISTSLILVFSFCHVNAQAAEMSPLGLPEMLDPSGNSKNPKVVELGYKLFFDKQLSSDGTIACGSCHIPEQAYVDNLKLAKGIEGRLGARKSPTVLNTGYNTAFFWDGRRDTLEEQVTDPFFNPNEHGLTDFNQLLQLVKSDYSYLPLFQAAFDINFNEIDSTHISDALAAYIRTLVAGDSRVDRYLFAGKKNALTDNEINGLELFRGLAECSSCHLIDKEYALFTDNDYHSMSIGFDQLSAKLPVLIKQAIHASPEEREMLIITDPDFAALGRFMVTLNPQDIGKFKTPSLRNIDLMAPYMHDGSIATLEDAVERELYYRGEKLGRPLILTPDEKDNLVAFIKALNSSVLP